MSADGKVIISTEVDNTGIETGFKQIESKSTKALSAMKKAVVALGLTKLAKDAVMLASDLEEVQNVVDVTFGQGNQKIETFAKNAATTFGMGELAAKQYTGTLGAMLKSMGLTDTAVEDMSTSMVQLAGDMASFYNLDHEDAFTKIRAGISGEVMPLRQLGINMSEVNLQSFAMAQGIEKSYKKMSEAEKVQLRYSYLMSVTADAQGDFARTSDSFANQLRIAQLQLQTTSAALGKELLPIATKGVKVIGELAKNTIPRLASALKWVLDNAQTLIPVITALWAAHKGYRIIDSVRTSIAGFVTSMLGETAAVNASTLALAAKTAAVKALTSAFSFLTSPVGLVAAGIVTLGAAIYNGLSAWREENAAIFEQTKALEEQREARQQLIDTQKEQIANQAGEIEYTRILANELYSLSDANGNIAQKDTERAKMLAEKLNPALGEMIRLNKDGTATIIQHKDAIDQLIQRKNAQIYLDAMEVQYKEALINVDKLRGDMIQTTMRLQAKQNELSLVTVQLQEAIATGDQKQIDMLTRKQGALQQQVIREEELLGQQSSAYAQSTSDIEKYTDMQTAFLEGRLNDVGRIYNTEYGIVRANLSSQRELAYQDMVEKKNQLKALEKMYKDGYGGITKAMVDEARSAYNKSATEWKQVGQNGAAGLLQGWRAGRGSLISYMGDLANAMLAKARSTFKQNSPSKAFEQISEYNVDGAVLGVKRGIPKAEAAIEAMANAMMRKTRIMDFSGLYAPDLSATIINNNNNSLTLDGRVVAQSTNRQNRILQLQYGVR